ncbi:UNVERIFIED_ORG: transposase-like protein [Rahnella aquatilis]
MKVKGQWKYLYRAVDSAGQTIDFLLTAWRDEAATLRFFRNTKRHHGEPEVVTIDKNATNAAAIFYCPFSITLYNGTYKK